MNNFSGERYETDQRENVLCEFGVSSIPIPLYHPSRFLGSNQISYMNVLVEVNEMFYGLDNHRLLQHEFL